MRAGEDDASAASLEDVAREQDPVARRVEADAPGRVAGRVDHPQAAQDRQDVAVLDRADARRRPGDRRQESPARRPPEGVADAQLQAGDVGRVHADLDVGRLQLGDAPGVVRVAVRADDPAQIGERPMVPLQAPGDPPSRAGEPGVDERDVVLEEGEGAHAHEMHRVDAGCDLHAPLRSTSEAALSGDGPGALGTSPVTNGPRPAAETATRGRRRPAPVRGRDSCVEAGLHREGASRDALQSGAKTGLARGESYYVRIHLQPGNFSRGQESISPFGNHAQRQNGFHDSRQIVCRKSVSSKNN